MSDVGVIVKLERTQVNLAKIEWRRRRCPSYCSHPTSDIQRRCRLILKRQCAVECISKLCEDFFW